MDRGQVSIQPASGRDIPPEWLIKHGGDLVIEMLSLLGRNGFYYESYTTGNYGKHRSGGVTLQLSDITTGDSAYSVFNADTCYQRNTKLHKQGDPLPNGQFRPAKKGNFINFWQGTGIKAPPRPSAYHDYMGKLKGIAFEGRYSDPLGSDKERLITDTLKPLNISHQELLAALDTQQQPDKFQTTPIQRPDNYPTNLPDKQLPPSPIQQGVEQVLTTGVNDYGTRLKGSAVIRDAYLPSKPPWEQTDDEWYADWDKRDSHKSRK